MEAGFGHMSGSMGETEAGEVQTYAEVLSGVAAKGADLVACHLYGFVYIQAVRWRLGNREVADY